LGPEEALRVVTISDSLRKVFGAQPAKVVLAEIGIVHEQRQVCLGELAALLESGDEVTCALVQLLCGLVYCLVVNIEPVRQVELEDEAVDIVVQVDHVSTSLARLAGQRLGDGLVSNGSNNARHSLDALGRVLPVLVNCLHNLYTILDAWNRQSFCGNRVDRSFDNTKVVLCEQVVVRPRLAVVCEWPDAGEDVEDARRRRGTVVEQEHDPDVNRSQNSELGRHDDGGLLIGIVVGKVAHCCKQLVGLVCSEGQVSSPDLVDMLVYTTNKSRKITNLADRVCDHVVRSNNAIVVTSSF
jgi:hypothetical protein